MLLHTIAAVFLALIAAAISVGVCMALAKRDPDVTLGGAYAALAVMVAPLVFLVTLGVYAVVGWIWSIWR